MNEVIVRIDGLKLETPNSRPDLMAQVRRQLSISTVSFESRDKWGTWTRRGAS